ncbi:Uncharacterised protein [Mycobacteroides abscessus]|nr:Uncharacterised protein [Mycobacteroides abscessus]
MRLVAFAGSRLIEPDTDVGYAVKFMDSMKEFLVQFAAAAKIGGVEDVAMLKMMDAGAQHIIDASDERGEIVSSYRLIHGD